MIPRRRAGRRRRVSRCQPLLRGLVVRLRGHGVEEHDDAQPDRDQPHQRPETPVDAVPVDKQEGTHPGVGYPMDAALKQGSRSPLDETASGKDHVRVSA